jgi:hypothetical protein
LDGKTIKHLAKRLKATRGTRGGLLGGRALVAQEVRSGLILGMHADADGEANDVRFVPDLVPKLRSQIGQPILWLADSQFGFPEVVWGLSSQQDRYLVRYHGNVKFVPDSQRAALSGTDAKGRHYTEEWGWLGGVQNKHRHYVRRITLTLGQGKPLVLITNLVESQQYPADVLLELYRTRWGIENVFQQITEVFGLARLIGSTAFATVFQLSFCCVLYNLTQAIRGVVAAAGNRPVAQTSGEKLFRDIKKDLISWQTVLKVEETIACFSSGPTVESVKKRLQELLGQLWRGRWAKAKPKRKVVPHPPGSFRRGMHHAVARILAEHKQKHNNTQPIRQL